MRKIKTDMFNKLKNKRSSKEYEMWFLRYVPSKKYEKVANSTRNSSTNSTRNSSTNSTRNSSTNSSTNSSNKSTVKKPLVKKRKTKRRNPRRFGSIEL